MVKLMKAGEEFFLRYLEGHDKRFVIPVYQRNYDWKRDQCAQLFDDILGIIKQKQESYFIGSIVSIHNDDSTDREYVVIDGQQRITTITLLLLCIHNMLENGELVSQNVSLKDQIREQYLENKYEEEDKRIRLKPIKEDNQALLKLFGKRTEDYIQDSNITLNYDYFVQVIRGLDQSKVTIQDLYDAIKKLVIVDVRLKRGEDNPQLIFESLNSTGKKLEEADLVRNFILMDKLPELQEKYYDTFWHPIEKNTNNKVGEFIRDFLTYETHKTPRKDRIYVEFKKFVHEFHNSHDALEALLKKLLDFSRFYNHFLEYNTADERINKALQHIDRLKVTVSYPFLLEVFFAKSQNTIDAKDTAIILETIESFVFRRIICDVPTNSLNKIFATLGRNIRRTESYAKRYLDVFLYRISSNASSNRFPDNVEFVDRLTRRDIYNLNNKNRIHLFEQIENFENREKVMVEELVEAKKEGLTFEHIMPQKLSMGWKNDLGEGFSDAHHKYLNTLGNLTLTAYNSGLSNKVFSDKLNQKNGFKDSRLWLNQTLFSFDKWTEKEIESRAENLADRCVQIWKFPETNYTLPHKEDAEIGLYEEYTFKGTKPKSFAFLDQSYLVSTWREVYQMSLKLFYELDSVRLLSLVDEPSHKRYLGTSIDSHNQSWKLNESIYLNINLSASTIISIIKGLFLEFDLDEAEFAITIHDDVT